jgi:hypothetical protein
LVGNRAVYWGGATLYSVLENCLVVSNTAFVGGGTYASKMRNCTLAFNRAGSQGGGSYLDSCTNSILFYNSASSSPNYSSGTLLSYCCSTPLFPGPGNFTNEPALVNPIGGNFRLQSNSPCIDTGNDSLVLASTDLDGRPRIVGPHVDVGAYEYQGAGMSEFINWLALHGLATDGSADYADSDGDGLNNWQEWRAGTDPRDPASVLKMLGATANTPGLTISWQSVPGVTYFLQRGTNVAISPMFSTIQNNLPGQGSVSTAVDPSATNAGPYFYRVGVQ